MVTIVQKDDPTLHTTSEDVPTDEIATPKIRKILDDMQEALSYQEDGVAIAAPQIGVALNIFIVSKRAFLLNNRGEPVDLTKEEKSRLKDMVFINPTITKLSRQTEWLTEGCLSVRWQYGKVKRAKKATVRAYDENGLLFTRGGSGLMAQIFQHETDHLKGVLFIEKAIEIENIPPAKE